MWIVIVAPVDAAGYETIVGIVIYFFYHVFNSLCPFAFPLSSLLADHRSLPGVMT